MALLKKRLVQMKPQGKIHYATIGFRHKEYLPLHGARPGIHELRQEHYFSVITHSEPCQNTPYHPNLVKHSVIKFR